MSEQNARAEGRSRIYQASGDQHIVEHHHHAPGWSGPDSVRRAAVGRPPLVLRDRTAEMARLRAAVEPGVGNGVHVLHGMGGCGKTAVAYALFQHATGQAGRVGLWVNASDLASLRAGMLAVAADRGASDGELIGARSGLRPAADLVWHYLDHSEQPWLLVLDNADDPSVLQDGWLRTSPSGTVIVTTRQPANRWWPGADLLHFGVLPRADAAKVLYDLAPHAGSIEDAAEVADRLGRLPLALTLAGGFLAHQVIAPWTLNDYRNRLDTTPSYEAIALLDQGALSDGGDSRHLVSRTWQLSLDALHTRGLPESTSLLRLLACWASDPLPLPLLSGAEIAGDLPAHRVESALRGLLEHSLTELLPGRVRCLRTHGVLLSSVARATPADQREALAETGVRLLMALLRHPDGYGVPNADTTLLAPHVLALLRRTVDWEARQSVVASATECAWRLVDLLDRIGDYSSALAAATEAAALAQRGLAADHQQLLRLRQRASRAVYRLGQFEEAESSARKVLDDCERALGAEHVATWESCLGLALPLWQLGRGSEALPLIRRAVAGRTEALGPLHPLTLLARTHILEVAAEQEFDEEVAIGYELVAQCRQALGRQNSITLTAELNQADLLRRAGRFGDALPLARENVVSNDSHYGAAHPFTLAARTQLSVILAETGRYEEAVGQAELAAVGRSHVLGPAHPWTRNSEERLREYRRAHESP
ncbi:tetratricopeptide repeat protein [Streptomyces sp. QL37]|uniref:tetratricopeptide repeat protein n=1 Tax=Streptomyces sp. QL37 TaxID=2093747 RepID=UPI000CF2DE6A|nr:tetratricopeptide repeat protein [Streptomyces sp. QL37]PPQ61929.1 ATP/GTP-binding protein [Streptomyces sp. QL37]